MKKLFAFVILRLNETVKVELDFLSCFSLNFIDTCKAVYFCKFSLSPKCILL
jgi:hypothetical protein